MQKSLLSLLAAVLLATPSIADVSGHQDHWVQLLARDSAETSHLLSRNLLHVRDLLDETAVSVARLSARAQAPTSKKLLEELLSSKKKQIDLTHGTPAPEGHKGVWRDAEGTVHVAYGSDPVHGIPHHAANLAKNYARHPENNQPFPVNRDSKKKKTQLRTVAIGNKQASGRGRTRDHTPPNVQKILNINLRQRKARTTVGDVPTSESNIQFPLLGKASNLARNRRATGLIHIHDNIRAGDRPPSVASLHSQGSRPNSPIGSASSSSDSDSDRSAGKHSGKKPAARQPKLKHKSKPRDESPGARRSTRLVAGQRPAQPSTPSTPPSHGKQSAPSKTKPAALEIESPRLRLHYDSPATAPQKRPAAASSSRP